MAAATPHSITLEPIEQPSVHDRAQGYTHQVRITGTGGYGPFVDLFKYRSLAAAKRFYNQRIADAQVPA